MANRLCYVLPFNWTRTISIEDVRNINNLTYFREDELSSAIKNRKLPLKIEGLKQYSGNCLDLLDKFLSQDFISSGTNNKVLRPSASDAL